MDKDIGISVENILATNKKTTTKDLHLIFKCDKFDTEIHTKSHRLDGKKILSSRYEEMYQSIQGTRCVGKKIGYVNGELQYFPAITDAKGKWVADTTQTPIPKEQVSKVITDLSSGMIAKKDTNKGIWFVKLVAQDVLMNWLVEETYNIFSEDNSDSCLKIYDYLMETKQIGVYRFNPYGTTYNGFMFPQRVNGGHFRLLLSLARTRIDKPEVAPTMVIANAQVRAKERERLDEIGIMSAIEEV